MTQRQLHRLTAPFHWKATAAPGYSLSHRGRPHAQKQRPSLPPGKPHGRTRTQMNRLTSISMVRRCPHTHTHSTSFLLHQNLIGPVTPLTPPRGERYKTRIKLVLECQIFIDFQGEVWPFYSTTPQTYGLFSPFWIQGTSSWTGSLSSPWITALRGYFVDVF